MSDEGDPGGGTYDEMSFFSHILPAHCVSPSDSTVVPHSHDQHVLPARLVGRHSPWPEHALVPFVQADEVVKHSEMEKTGPEPILDDGAATASWRRVSWVEGGVRMRMNGSWVEDRDEMDAWMTPSAVEYCSDAGSRSVSELSERAWTGSDVFSLLKKPVESTHSDSAVSSCFTALLASGWGAIQGKMISLDGSKRRERANEKIGRRTIRGEIEEVKERLGELILGLDVLELLDELLEEVRCSVKEGREEFVKR